MDTLFIPGWLITGLIVAVIIVVLLVKGYVNAKPNEVVVITGLRKQRHLRGKAGFMIPFVEQRSYLDIEQFSTDVRTSEAVPTLDFINVRADAAVKLKIGTTDEMIARAAENFLNWNTTDISNSVQDVLEGNLREVIGQMELRKMVNDRQEFASKVQDNVAPDLTEFMEEVLIDDNMVFDIDNLKGFLNDTSSFGFIAKENNKIIGFAYCYTLLRPDGKTMFYLHSIGMLPNYQDKGYGSKLLSFIKEYSKEIGCSEMFLITDKGNPRACHVYEKLGGKNDYKDEIVYVYDYEKGDK